MSIINAFPQSLNISGGGGVDYSTTEQKTGRKWIDGKDIYCITKVINLSGSSDRQSFSFNAAFILEVKGVWLKTDNGFTSITNSESNGAYSNTWYYSNNNFYLVYGSSMKPQLKTAYFTIYYTKN